MPSNQYHILCRMPTVEAWEMPGALEALAQKIVQSGKLRVNAEYERNFVHYGEASYSVREVTDSALRPATFQRLSRQIAPAMGQQGLEDAYHYLRRELKKARGVSEQKEIRVARVLVQAAHPAVIQLLIREQTEIFVSHYHNVSDLITLPKWKTLGDASGLQSTEDTATAVYVSAGGDPFFEGEHKTYTTDGFPALARLMIVAAQELGHFADLRRVGDNIAGRHSAGHNYGVLTANPIAREARLYDQSQVAKLTHAYEKAGLKRLCIIEQKLMFYHTQVRLGLRWWGTQLLRLLYTWQFKSKCTKNRLFINFKTLPKKFLGQIITRYLEDMAFNLAPDADAYRDDNPTVEEAILVIESVARVPQQEVKWGSEAVMQSWPGLYQFYYGSVIKSCILAVNAQDYSKITNVKKSLIVSLKQRFRAKPGYAP